jgi:hypothetical protein
MTRLVGPVAFSCGEGKWRGCGWQCRCVTAVRLSCGQTRVRFRNGEFAMSFKQIWLIGLCCAVFVGLHGCRHARIITEDGSGGVVAIPDNSDHWPSWNHKRAMELIEKRCPQGYTIVKQEEVVVGKTRTTSTNTDHSPDPIFPTMHERTSQTTTFTNKTEWRIYFQKAGATVYNPTFAPAHATSGVIPTNGVLSPSGQ